MERLWKESGANADWLPPPDGLDRYAVLRSLDRERLSEVAPDVPAERRARIVRIRDEIRRGRYDTDDRVRVALERAFEAADRPPPPRRRT
jgi:hypothetical protein